MACLYTFFVHADICICIRVILRGAGVRLLGGFYVAGAPVATGPLA